MYVQLMPDDSPTSTQRNGDWASQLAGELPPVPLRPLQPEFDWRRYAAAGCLAGALAGCVSLVLNVIGGAFWPTVSGVAQHPLRLIQVFLTFPLGEEALHLQSGAVLALGCVLYLATGVVYGLLFVLALAYFVPGAGLLARLIACSAMAIVVWGVNFYGVLAWLQPLALGGNWIADLVPWWVGALTHLAFGWTVAVLYPLTGTVRKDAATLSE